MLEDIKLEVSPVIVDGRPNQDATIAAAKKALHDAIAILTSAYCYHVKVDGKAIGEDGLGLTQSRALAVYKTLVDAAESKVNGTSRAMFYPEIRYQTIELYCKDELLDCRKPNVRSLDRRAFRANKHWNRASVGISFAGHYTISGNPCRVSMPAFKGHNTKPSFTMKEADAVALVIGKPAYVETNEDRKALETKCQATIAMFGGRLV